MILVDNGNGVLQGSAEISIDVVKLSQLDIWIFLHVLLERILIDSISNDGIYPSVTGSHGFERTGVLEM
jgi:hypothetical protein